MSVEAIALVERFLAALNQSDWSAAAELLSGEVELDLPSGERQIGHEAFRWWIAGRRREGRETFADIAAMASADGSRAAAEFTLRREAGGAVNAGMFFAISGGRIERVTCCNFPE